MVVVMVDRFSKKVFGGRFIESGVAERYRPSSAYNIINLRAIRGRTGARGEAEPQGFRIANADFFQRQIGSARPPETTTQIKLMQTLTVVHA